MSNIHTLSSLKNSRHPLASNPNQHELSISIEQPAQPNKVDIKALLSFCFPKFTYKSFIFVISCVQILIFIVTQIINSRVKGTKTYPCILYEFGAKYTPAISVFYHIHRLILPILLHGGYSHIVGNILTQFMYGFILEDYYKTKNIIILYLMSGLGGNLLSAIKSRSDISVGASSAIFGLMALKLSYILQNYHSYGNKKNIVLILMILLIALNFSSSAESSTIDIGAHIGGFIIGGLTSYILYSNPSDPMIKTKKQIAAAFIGLYVFILFVIVITFRGMESTAYSTASTCSAIYNS